MTPNKEDYLKMIYELGGNNKKVSNKQLVTRLMVSAASVSEMVTKLLKEGFVEHVPYQGIQLTQAGLQKASALVRKHRLWEVFLVEKLNFSWDEVHEIAEELEHIKSEVLINKLDEFLGFPSFDPHGDPIPDGQGIIKKIEKHLLSDAEVNKDYKCIGVKDSSTDFLKYLDKQKIALGSVLKIVEREEFDETLTIAIDGKRTTISNKIASNLYVQ